MAVSWHPDAAETRKRFFLYTDETTSKAIVFKRKKKKILALFSHKEAPKIHNPDACKPQKTISRR